MSQWSYYEAIVTLERFGALSRRKLVMESCSSRVQYFYCFLQMLDVYHSKELASCFVAPCQEELVVYILRSADKRFFAGIPRENLPAKSLYFSH